MRAMEAAACVPSHTLALSILLTSPIMSVLKTAILRSVLLTIAGPILTDTWLWYIHCTCTCTCTCTCVPGELLMAGGALKSQNDHIWIVLWSVWAGGILTHDILRTRQVLYQLSHRGSPAGQAKCSIKSCSKLSTKEWAGIIKPPKIPNSNYMNNQTKQALYIICEHV